MTSPHTLVAVRPGARSMESVLASRWARLLIPSLADLFFLAVLIWLFMSSGSAGWQGLLVDGDVGWHIRNGQYIIDHHAVPHNDLYSFSKPGAPWYAWEWLSDVLDGSLERLAGLKGIVLMTAVVIGSFATTLILRTVGRGVNLLIALVVGLLGVGASAIHYLARPHIFTLLLLSISVGMIESDRERPSRRIWFLVPLTMLWTNLHGGFPALIAVLGLAAIGTGVEAWAGRDPGRASWKKAGRYSALTIACAAASLVNPYGYQLHLHMWEYLRSDWIRNTIQEFQSPSFRGEFMLQFEVLLIGGLLAAGSLARRWRVVEALWIVFWAHMALASARHMPIFIAVTVPVIAAEVGEWWNQATGTIRKSSLIGILNQMAADSASGFRRASLWPAIVILGLVFAGKPIPWPQDFPSQLFPVEMVRAHRQELLDSRVLTTDQWADYLIYTNPNQKVFVDGRSDFYGPEIGNQYLHLTTGQADWEQVITRYGFNLALLPVDSAISQLLKQSPAWRLVEDDGKHVLLVRRVPQYPSTGNTSPEPRS